MARQSANPTGGASTEGAGKVKGFPIFQADGAGAGRCDTPEYCPSWELRIFKRGAFHIFFKDTRCPSDRMPERSADPSRAACPPSAATSPSPLWQARPVGVASVSPAPSAECPAAGLDRRLQGRATVHGKSPDPCSPVGCLHCLGRVHRACRCLAGLQPILPVPLRRPPATHHPASRHPASLRATLHLARLPILGVVVSLAR